jgi:hypothetical protein
MSLFTITEARPVYNPSQKAAYRFYRLSEHLVRLEALRKAIGALEKDPDDSPIEDTHVVEANRAKMVEAFNTDLDVQSIVCDLIEWSLEGNKQAVNNHAEAAWYLANLNSLPSEESAQLCTVMAANELDFDEIPPEEITEEQLAERENKVYERIKDPRKWKSLKEVRPGRRYKALGVRFASK